jgi:hypothetical protein
MFPDCLSDRARYMRVEPIDLLFGKVLIEKGYHSHERRPAYAQSTLRRADISQNVECCENGSDKNYLRGLQTSNDRKQASGSTVGFTQKKDVSTYDIHDVLEVDCQSHYNDGS